MLIFGVASMSALITEPKCLLPLESSINRWTDESFCLAVTNINGVWVVEDYEIPQVGGFRPSVSGFDFPAVEPLDSGSDVSYFIPNQNCLTPYSGGSFHLSSVSFPSL